MELQPFGNSLDYSRKKRKWLAVFGALGLTCYGGYRFYNSAPIAEKKQKLLNLFNALVSVAKMMSDSADAIGILSKDLKQFLASDTDQIPQSFKQVSKLIQSDEFSESTTCITRATTLGIFQGYQYASIPGGDRTFSDKIMDKLFSEAGSGFASVVLGSFARNLVMTLYSEWEVNNGDFQEWIEVATGDKCRQLIGDCICSFVGTAVSVYLDRTKHINTYDELFSGLTNPKHEATVKNMLVAVCNAAVETYIRTHINSPKHNTTSPYSKFDLDDGFSGDERLKLIYARRVRERSHDVGWSRRMCSVLAVPGNRRFVLDVTGHVTFEAVRSFLEFLVHWVAGCVRNSVEVVHEEVVDRGVEAVRCVVDKSSAVTALCLTLCLNILNSPWILTNR